MARQLQLRRGTTAQHTVFTGAVGEVTIDTDKDALVVHDGVQAGGFPAARESVVTAHTGNTSNPHSVTKAQVGLGNVDNTSDANKPVSTATQTALNLKANQATTYTKTEVDTALGLKVDKTSSQALSSTNALSASGGIITLTKGDGTSDSVTIPSSVLAGTGLSKVDQTVNFDPSSLTTATTELVSTDFVVVVDGTVPKKVTISNFTQELTAATATVKGIVELATNAETATGTDTTRAVTPAGLMSAVYSKSEVDALTGNTNLNGAYGLAWNQETDVYQRIGSRFDVIQSQMKRCVLNGNGTVNYYLDANDSTKKADGTAADLTGASGNVMVEIPKFWYKHELVNNDHKWMVSPIALAGYSVHPAFTRGGVEVNYRYYRAYEGFTSGTTLISRSGVTPTKSKTIATFRTEAAANGTDWGLVDWNLLHAVQVLFLTEYGTFNSQAVLGRGNDTGTDYGITTGQSNLIGNGSTGPVNADMWMSYRGIENWYADIWEFIDGINIQNYVPFVNNALPSTYASDVFTGNYVSTGVTMINAASNTFVKKVTGQFFPTVAGGNSSTFLTDAFWSATGNRVLLFGGAAGDGLSDGTFYLAVNNAASHVHVLIGAGVSR